MERSKDRGRWGGAQQEIQMPLSVPAVKEEVPPQYEHYLRLLQERNRLMKKLRHKDKKQIELEKKEKGFTLYLNTSLSEEKIPKERSEKRNHPRRAKTTGAADSSVRPSRNKSSPQGNDKGMPGGLARERRRNWQIGSVEFTTADGQRQKIKAPEILSGKYNDDFDDSSSDDDSYKISESLEDDNLSSSQSSLNTPRRHKTSYLKRVAAAKKEEIETENRITITMEDVKKLRTSLQMNRSIRESLAFGAESDSIEDLTLDYEKDNSDGERISPINEEEIEEMISSDDNIEDESVKPLTLMKPGDTLVLEFQPLQVKNKSAQSLSAVRRKASDSSKAPSTPPSVKQPLTSPSPSSFKSNGSSKGIRPLSASRKSSDSKTDPQDEASAVIKALQEENKKAELFSKVSRPLPQPKNRGSANNNNCRSPEKTATPSAVKSNAIPEVSKSGSTRGSMTDSAEVMPDGSNVDHVINRVMKMDAKQQKKLLQTLNHIDTEEESLPVMSRKALVASSWSSKAPVTDRLEVTLEILSNWGHSSLVGLTELHFYDKSGCLILIKPSDVSVHGAKDSSNHVDVLFNGKSKTTKERNMWSCRFDGRPIEFSILLINPAPGKSFQLGGIKIWNWNNKISNLDVGARQVRIFFGGELLFNGEVDKGCGNQVFDYSKHIVFSSPDSQSSSTKARKSSSKQDLSLNISPSNSSSRLGRLSGQKPVSPSKGVTTPSKGEGSAGSHHIFRSISRSSQSSASSSGSLPSASRARAGSEERSEERPSSKERSETRTLMRPTILKRRGSGGSGSSPDLEAAAGDVSVMPEKKRAQTPLKTKRVAAKLNGRSSETDNSSKSNADSYESKPPLPPAVNKSDEKSVSKLSGSSQMSSMKSKPSPKSSKSEPHVSPRVSPSLSANSVSSTKSTSEINESKEKNSLVDHMKALNVTENKRKKDIPKWLKKDSGNDSTSKDTKSQSSSAIKQDEEIIHKQLDEEFERFSQSGKEDKNKSDKAAEEEKDILTPMKKIEKSRAKWRTKEEDLEESWGSLSYFNKSQRGRLSIDMTDDALDEYLSSATKKKTTEEPPKLALPDDTWEDEDADDFTIPELPYGRELVINIKTTWGDHHYVGLTGVQLFSSEGEAVTISKVWANPSDINILQEYNRDPRVISNIIDNVNRTRDDVHMWLSPFTAGNNHLVYMTFAKPCKIALMRIWNYNKSRIHSFRGAKDVVITLDGTEIFKGEIARACGGIEGGTEAFGDTILFTTDEGILESVSMNDDAFEGEMPDGDQEELPSERPSTADAEDDTRPFTRASGLLPAKEEKPRPTTSFITYSGDVLVFKTNSLELLFTATWGDHHYLGLTGMEVVGKEGESIPIDMSMISAKPTDLRHLQGNERDERTLDKLVDGVNVTSHDSHMWLIPFTEGENHSVTIQFPEQIFVTGVRIWNYNKSPEDTYRGAKVMHVKVNNRMISPQEGYLLRKGPGVCHFDFAQEISFSNPSQSQDNDKFLSSGDNSNSNLIQMPRGFIFQLQIFSTWGDQYYAGLNGLEFYDTAFNKIELAQNNISAYPDSVNVLDNINNDARTPDKLIDGVNESNDGRHMWLAPVLPGIINRVYVIFDQPTTISMIKLWNYSKTVNRGTKDFALLVDDLLVYNGTLQAVSAGAKGILPTCNASIPHHTILFSDNKDIAYKERNAIISNQTEDQDIQLLNDKQIVSKFSNSSAKKPVNQALRPKTSVSKTSRR